METKFCVKGLLAGIIFLISGCSDFIQVYSDFDPDIDILQYRTYGWPDRTEIESRNNPLLYNELTDRRIRKAVDQQLQLNGYRYAEADPDLKVHYHIVVQDKALVRLDDPRNDSYSPYWLKGRTQTFLYQEGTLIIDLMDSRTCNLIWRGWAIEALNEEESYWTEKDIDKAITRIFSNYPRHTIRQNSKAKS